MTQPSAQPPADLRPAGANPLARSSVSGASASGLAGATRVSVIGAGLAGWLVALALARRGAAVTLFGTVADSATAHSYGGLLGRAAARDWRELERRHGPLGWTPARLVLHGWPAPLDRLPPGWQGLASWAVSCSRLSIPTLMAALPAVAQRRGIAWRPETVVALQPEGSGWLLRLDSAAGSGAAAGGKPATAASVAPGPPPARRATATATPAQAPADSPPAADRGWGSPAALPGPSDARPPADSARAGPFGGSDSPMTPAWPTSNPPPCPSEVWEADQVVLAAGAGCRRLWPQLAPRLRCSWAGALRLDTLPEGGSAWLEPLHQGALVLPRHWQRPALEARADQLEQPAWIVDAGLVPWDAGALLGQISLIRPQPDPGAAPDPGWMEERLRRGLAQLDPMLASLPGRYQQVAVPFCVDGQPLLGPVDDAPGLWICTGFRSPFGGMPRQAEALAAALLAFRG